MCHQCLQICSGGLRTGASPDVGCSCKCSRSVTRDCAFEFTALVPVEACGMAAWTCMTLAACSCVERDRGRRKLSCRGKGLRRWGCSTALQPLRVDVDVGFADRSGADVRTGSRKSFVTCTVCLSFLVDFRESLTLQYRVTTSLPVGRKQLRRKPCLPHTHPASLSRFIEQHM